MFRPSAKVVIVARLAVGPEVLQDLDAVARGLSLGRGERVLERLGDPEPAAIVEGDVDRLVDLGLGGDELDHEPFGEVEGLALLLGRVRVGGRDVLGLGRGRVGRVTGAGTGSCCQERQIAFTLCMGRYPVGWASATTVMAASEDSGASRIKRCKRDAGFRGRHGPLSAWRRSRREGAASG